jgi:radical SAM superfamily enzyme YgiQ (UPF0313 family)
MRILMIQGAPWTNSISLGVTTLGAQVKEKGHEYKVFDLYYYDFEESTTETNVGETQLEFEKVSNPKRMPQIAKKSMKKLFSDFREINKTYLPDLICVSAMSGDFVFSKRLLDKVRKEIKVPILVGGICSTVDPDRIIAEPWVDMINIGQGEESFMEVIESLEKKDQNTSIKNIWFKVNGEIIKNPTRPIVRDLDLFPVPDHSVYDDFHFYRPFRGQVYRHTLVEIARGCPLRCKYCLNSWLPTLYGDTFYSKSVERAVSEFEFLRDKYNIELFGFMDEIFLHHDIEFFEELAEKYSKRVNVPFYCQTTATSATPEKVKLLKQMNCVTVSLGVETGSEELRKNVLNKKVLNKHYENAYKLFNEAGIRTTAQMMFGLPNETEEDYIQSIRMIKKWKVDTAHAGIFYPYMGTVMRDESIKNGLLDKEKLEEFEKDSFISPRVTQTFLNFTDEQIKIMNHYKNNFTLYTELPEWLWPLVRDTDESDEYGKKLYDKIRNLVYNTRFEKGMSHHNPGDVSHLSSQVT